MLPLVNHSAIQSLLLVLALIMLWILLRASLRFWLDTWRRQQRLVDKINGLLPQTQCGQCGYEGCMPYARAIASGIAINQCPPGGNNTIKALALLLNEFPRPLNPTHGRIEEARVAFIREAECIGCTKCINACPVDAIVGAAKLMHTVIVDECTGCDLCVEPCPVDCIDMLPLSKASPSSFIWRWQLPAEIPAPGSLPVVESRQ